MISVRMAPAVSTDKYRPSLPDGIPENLICFHNFFRTGSKPRVTVQQRFHDRIGNGVLFHHFNSFIPVLLLDIRNNKSYIMEKSRKKQGFSEDYRNHRKKQCVNNLFITCAKSVEKR